MFIERFTVWILFEEATLVRWATQLVVAFAGLRNSWLHVTRPRWFQAIAASFNVNVKVHVVLERSV